MIGLSKTNIIGISSIVLASSISLYSYITDFPQSLILEQDTPLVSIFKTEADCGMADIPTNQATPVSATNILEQNKTELITLNKNETLMAVLTNLGIEKKQISCAINELKKIYNPRALKQGQELSVEYTAADDVNSAQLKSLNFKTSAGNVIELVYDDQRFTAQKSEVKLIKVLRKVEGNISSSFYTAAVKRGVPANIVKEAISTLSYDVNWQHDPKSGDEFRILFEVYEDEAGKIVKTGDLKFAAFAPSGNWKKIYAFKTSAGIGFYNDKGESVVKNLLATPVDSTRMRITSRFGRRIHPTLGYSKMHKGIDFGAPTGTPVSSAGDGVVLKAGWNGSYGNYVLIKHNNQYSTAYAHLSKINVKPGQKVRQRQNIGSVGSTGRSSGPHLHYEVICNGKQINPLSVKQLPAIRLTSKELAKFQEVKSRCDIDMSKAIPATQLAATTTPTTIG